MRQQRQSAAEEIDDRKPIARKGRVNKADKLTRAEKKARKKAQKEDAFFADGGNGGNGGNGSGGQIHRDIFLKFVQKIQETC